MRLQTSENPVDQSARNDDFWRAVVERNAKFNGVFVYTVASTRIFCRPICPAKRPRRKNVRFFADANIAAKNGFRACKRCRPNDENSTQTALARRVCALLETTTETISLVQLSRETGVSASHLQRVFKREIGVSPRQYAEALRQDKLKSALQNTNRVLDAALDAGYNSSRALYESSPLGMTPTKYRRGGEKMTLNFDVAPCALGFLLVAATDKGVCSVALGDSKNELEAALRREFPRAAISRDSEKVRDALQIALRVLDGENLASHLPLDVCATAFQARVWKELRAIKRGETSTYSQLAQKIGQPTAARAVARACATNPIALIVPCHRVVGKSGALSGYRWGIERKKKLLEREKTRSDGSL